jgi:hypothetical protein
MGVPDDEPFPFFITPTQEYVVPKSMPMTEEDELGPAQAKQHTTYQGRKSWSPWNR